jgi:hypothetical protein
MSSSGVDLRGDLVERKGPVIAVVVAGSLEGVGDAARLEVSSVDHIGEPVTLSYPLIECGFTVRFSFPSSLDCAEFN